MQKFKYALVMRVYKWEPASSEAAVGYILNVFKVKSFLNGAFDAFGRKSVNIKVIAIRQTRPTNTIR